MLAIFVLDKIPYHPFFCVFLPSNVLTTFLVLKFLASPSIILLLRCWIARHRNWASIAALIHSLYSHTSHLQLSHSQFHKKTLKTNIFLPLFLLSHLIPPELILWYFYLALFLSFIVHFVHRSSSSRSMLFYFMGHYGPIFSVAKGAGI